MPSTEQVTTSAAYLPPPDRPHQRTTSPTTTSLPVVGKLNCINCKCPACGFKKLWLDGLRKHVVDGDGNVMDSAPIEFQSEVKWMRIRSSKKTEPGEAKQPNYEPRTGTVVQFLDEFERDIMSKFPHHRFTVHRQKEAAAEFDRNRCPGWVQSDVDFAMDGVILPPKGHAIQSDHWSPMSFTCFVSISSAGSVPMSGSAVRVSLRRATRSQSSRPSCPYVTPPSQQRARTGRRSYPSLLPPLSSLILSGRCMVYDRMVPLLSSRSR